ncbi:MAG: hypothetical protein L6R40_007769 [Gallowayella cf. fulva]|nr:MAG: hypothetical protein L6R40_007769 [Xanthomendoza cf. fulva]
MPHATRSRILFIDAYDSFSNNIVSLLETRLPAVHVTVIRIDEYPPDFTTFLQDFDAVVAGPGPGHPEISADVGLISKLWRLGEEDILPILGVCLGFQSLVTAFGGRVMPLPNPQHGIVRKATSSNSSIFKQAKSIATVQYHSLYAQDVAVSDSRTSTLEPLAWDFKAHNDSIDPLQAHQQNPDAILMAVKHRTKPFYGIQFHPESICSDERSKQVVENWWAEAQQWNKQRKDRYQVKHIDKQTPKQPETTDPLRDGRVPETRPLQQDSVRIAIGDDVRQTNVAGLSPLSVIHRVLPLGGLSVPKICDALNLDDADGVVLDAEPYQRADTGTHSIIGVLEPTTTKIRYVVGSGKVSLCQGDRSHSIDLAPFDHQIFDYLKVFMMARKATGGHADIPFWGGLVGYINYEACLETIKIRTSGNDGRPDVSFAFIERSVVIDHQCQQIHVQSIKPEDDDWVKMISSKFTTSNMEKSTEKTRQHPTPFNPSFLEPVISYPDPIRYATKIRKCQEYIHSGDSYELCLTNQATIESNSLRHPWALYLHLRSLNAAPFSAYMRLGGMTLLSSSPERFMRWTRPTTSDADSRETRSTVQFRPIKGTVKRYPSGRDQPAITLQQATALLSTPKERAENLMIVDLIRHDLHSVVGSGNVCVPKLMVVEEYATLFQLVTVVEGTLINDNTFHLNSNVPSLLSSPRSSPSTSRPATPRSASLPVQEHVAFSQCSAPSDRRKTGRKTGIDVLAASLPPGSMTGAPKRRSCALLRQIEEEKARGIYSGVVGYMDVGGAGDFSVVIRSAFRWDDDTTHHADLREKRDKWTVGAGGAITALSTEHGEWEEMVAKLESTLKMFG